MTKVINFFGGPGVGKSTTASGVFHELKKRDIRAEYVSEYAKDCVWEETTKLLENQIHVFSEQLRRQYRLMGKVDYIVTDSPLLLASIYYQFYTERNPHPFFSDRHTEMAIEFFDATFKEFDNLNFVLIREKPYDAIGRKQNEAEAKYIDDLVMEKLINENYSYHLINYYSGVDETLSFVST